MARKLIAEAGCYKTLDISPPPAVGGYLMRNVDPLDTMFDPPFLMNLTSTVVDMIDQTIGALEFGTVSDPTAGAIEVQRTFEKGYVFIAMPINKDTPELDDVLDSIKDVCANNSLVAERVDEMHTNDKITDNILDGITKAEFVIADLTYSKPNVYLEAGYALASGKTPIFICKANHTIEFDVKD